MSAIVGIIIGVAITAGLGGTVYTVFTDQTTAFTSNVRVDVQSVNAIVSGNTLLVTASIKNTGDVPIQRAYISEVQADKLEFVEGQLEDLSGIPTFVISNNAPNPVTDNVYRTSVPDNADATTSTNTVGTGIRPELVIGGGSAFYENDKSPRERSSVLTNIEVRNNPVEDITSSESATLKLTISANRLTSYNDAISDINLKSKPISVIVIGESENGNFISEIFTTKVR